MAKGNMTLRMEPELKAQAAALFKSLGMDLSTATGIFYRQALRCHGLPFEVKVDEPNAVTFLGKTEVRSWSGRDILRRRELFMNCICMKL